MMGKATNGLLFRSIRLKRTGPFPNNHSPFILEPKKGDPKTGAVFRTQNGVEKCEGAQCAFKFFNPILEAECGPLFGAISKTIAFLNKEFMT
jgi:hypothetical protein